MRRLLAFATAVVLAAVPFQVSPAAAAKAGATCTKAGATSGAGAAQLLCTKSGKKLLWVARPAAGKPKPVPSATPTPTPFKAPVPISLPVPMTGSITFANAVAQYAQIPQVAWQNVQDVVQKNTPVDVPVTLSIGPNTNTTPEIIKALLQKEFALWQGFTQPPSFTGLVYNAKDEAWAESEFPKLAARMNLTGFDYNMLATGQLRNGCGFENNVATECWGGSVAIFPNTDAGFAFFGVQEPFWSATSDQSGPISQVVHEYNHAVQFAQWIGKVPPAKELGQPDRAVAAHAVIPCWYQEGHANAIGVPLASKTLAQYLTGRDNSIRRGINTGTPVKPSLSQNALTADALTNFLYTQDPTKCYDPVGSGDYQLGYSVGYAAAEALVAIGGPQSTMAMYAQAASGMTWAEAFQAVYGITWKDGADVLGKVLAAEYAAKPMDH